MKKLLVLCGGCSTERVISRMSCTSLLKNIDRSKYDLTLIGIDESEEWYQIPLDTDLTSDNWLEQGKRVSDIMALLKSQDVAYPMLHGLYGEDGTIQGLFELAQLPYVGCRVLGSSVALDKIYAKMIFKSAGIPQVESVYVKKRFDGKLVVVNEDFSESSEVEKVIAAKLGYPCFIKASNSGSSVGCYRVDRAEDLLDRLKDASQYDRKILVERCVDCIELETAVMGVDDITVSRVGQIKPHGEFYTFESKYYDSESATVIPALVDESIQAEIRAYAVRAFKAIDGFGLSRVDFFLDKANNQVYLNEVNTMPGFTDISMYPQLMMDLGMTYSEILDKLIELAK